MKVSIIVPVYKVERYLRPCLESILAQTVSDYEVILVDDGSPDGCPVICEEYAARDPRFRVIHKENGGLSSARNAGLDVAAGKYIYFLDSDDTIDPDLLETMVPRMERGLDLAVFGHRILHEDGSMEPGRRIRTGSFSLASEQERLSFLVDTLIPCALGWEAWSRMFVREKIEKYGLRFADNRQIFAEDLYFSLCYCAHASKIESMECCLYNYRVREDSIMGAQQAKSNLGRISRLGQAVLSYYRRFDDCALLTENFDSIYYALMAGQFTFQLWSSGLPVEEFRTLVWEEIKDWDFVEQQLRQYLRRHRISRSLEEWERRINIRFLLGGSALVLRAQCKLLRRLKERKQGEIR